MGGGDGVEQVDGCVPHSMVAVDVEELAAGAVETVEGHLIGIDGGTAGTQEGSRCADVGGRGGGGVKGSYGGTQCIRGGSGRSTGRRKPHPVH